MSDSLLMLLEMIEEVLNEATLTYKDLGKRNNKKLFFDKIKNGEPFETKDGREVVIDVEKSKTFLELVTNNQPLPRGEKMVTTTGEKISFSNLQKTGTVFGTASTGGSKKIHAEKFEGNLVLALGGITDLQKQAGVIQKNYPKLSYNNFQEAQDIANKVVTSAKLPDTGKWQKLPTSPLDVTELYKYFGVKQGVPKTDITDGSKSKISVKKNTASMLSAESGETRALLAVGLGFKKVGQLENSPLSKKIDLLAAELSKQKWNAMNTKQRRDQGNLVLKKILEFVETAAQSKQLKYNILLEAVTGNNRFNSDLAKANKMLVWNEEGQGKNSDIKEWAEANNDGLSLDIRWRGEDRSGGFRIDVLSDRFKKRMEKILGDMSFYPKEQLATRTSQGLQQRPSKVELGYDNVDVYVGMETLLKDIIFEELRLAQVSMSFGGVNIFEPKSEQAEGT